MHNITKKIYIIFIICFSATWLYAMDSLDDEAKIIRTPLLIHSSDDEAESISSSLFSQSSNTSDDLIDVKKQNRLLDKVSLSIKYKNCKLRITRKYTPEIITDIRFSSPDQTLLDSDKLLSYIKYMDSVAYDKFEDSCPVVIPNIQPNNIDNTPATHSCCAKVCYAVCAIGILAVCTVKIIYRFFVPQQ